MANIVIFGCRKITIDIISHIIDKYPEHNITGVVTHDFERDRIYYKDLVYELCNSLGIPNIRFDKKIDPNIISNMKPDIIFSLYYRLILRQDILDIPKMGCINIHPGYLPKDRGPAPSLWNILNNDEFAGVTMHYMVKAVDAGDMIDQKRIPALGMIGFGLNVKLMEMGTELFIDNFEDIMCGKNNRLPQDHGEATYTLNFAKYLRYLSWDDPVGIMNKLRAFAPPFDGAIAYCKNTTVIATKGNILDKRDSFSAPGFYEVTKDGIIIQTCDLPVIITEYSVVGLDLKRKGRFESGPPLAGGLNG